MTFELCLLGHKIANTKVENGAMSGISDAAMNGRLRTILLAIREFLAGQTRLHERQALLNRPWEEDFLHFARDGRLHGHILPPDDGRRRGVTSDGWCPCWARQASGRSTGGTGSAHPS